MRSEVPLFPLHTVLFPGGVLQLRVFEQRYLEMTKVCLRDDAPFGAALIREGREVGSPAVPETVGCLARIAQWDMPQLGLFHLVAHGTERFRILDTRVARDGLITASIELLPAEAAAEVDATCRDVLRLVIEKAGAERFPAPLRLEDAAWVAYRLAEILPIDTAARQQMLEMQDAAERFTHLRGLLAARGLLP